MLRVQEFSGIYVTETKMHYSTIYKMWHIYLASRIQFMLTTFKFFNDDTGVHVQHYHILQ